MNSDSVSLVAIIVALIMNGYLLYRSFKNKKELWKLRSRVHYLEEPHPAIDKARVPSDKTWVYPDIQKLIETKIAHLEKRIEVLESANSTREMVKTDEIKPQSKTSPPQSIHNGNPWDEALRLYNQQYDESPPREESIYLEFQRRFKPVRAGVVSSDRRGAGVPVYLRARNEGDIFVVSAPPPSMQLYGLPRFDLTYTIDAHQFAGLEHIFSSSFNAEAITPYKTVRVIKPAILKARSPDEFELTQKGGLDLR